VPVTNEVTLVEMPGPGQDGKPTMRPGTYAVDDEPFGPPYVSVPAGGPAALTYADVLAADGARGTVVLHPDDLVIERHWISGRAVGCCGPAGMDGPNLKCACGSEIATEVNDCYTPHEVRLEPTQVSVGT
jgi:hypothetical protein